MKKQILNYITEAWSVQQITCTFSFQPFLQWLQQRVTTETSAKVHFYKMVLQRLEAWPGIQEDIPVGNIYQYEELLEWIYACLTPVATSEQDIMWALWLPVQPIMVYGTDAFYELIQSHKIDLSHRTPEDFRREQLQMVYTYILKKIYHFNPRQNEYYHAYLNPATNLLQYYTIDINADFIEVIPNGPLPQLSRQQLANLLQEGAGYTALENILPLNLFRFRGISVSTITDVTVHHALDNLRQVRLTRDPEEREAAYQQVIRSLKTLVRNDKTQFDLFPMVLVNGRYVYGYEVGGTGILYSIWGDRTLTPQQFEMQAAAYAANPKAFFSPDVRKEEATGMNQWLIHFVQAGVRSLATLPVFHAQKMVGTFCMYTLGEEIFDEQNFTLLETAMPAIGQILQIFIDEFNLEIEDIIRERYTSVQPAVQWKFREAAWQHLYHTKKQLPPARYPIQFKDLYPLYGAIDIRSSSTERNKAIILDLGAHLQLLHNTLDNLKSAHPSPLMEQMNYTIHKWQQVLAQGIITATDETNINTFLTGESGAWLEHLATQHPDARKVIDDYRQIINDEQSIVFAARQALETSMQLINSKIGAYLDEENTQLQKQYPCYFEKFRTDGIEYDCYIGQSIAPDKAFNHFHLKSLRLWQLTSMAAIARLTQSLVGEMPVQLQTTQLIFVHNTPIDITFRTDERRFDVEGAYNIRYQVIKKRIDKVHVRHTGQRLTQPGTLAIIYFHRSDLDDYMPSLQYLQETGVFLPNIEELELEDLQGVTGLRALRITIAL
ncbi:MAG: GAF domain-containing protein [Niastella sp.]|nr:GAF domain-containing protein [Niastella sp.]